MSRMVNEKSRGGFHREGIDHYLLALGIKREKLANYSDAIRYRDALNGEHGEHILTFNNTGFTALRRAFGSSLRCCALCGYHTGATAHALATNAGDALRDFIAGQRNRVIVMSRCYDVRNTILVERTLCGAPRQLLEGDVTLLLPTSAKSPRTRDELYLRIDLSITHIEKWFVRNVLFTTSSGDSLAGFGDFDKFVEGIEDLLPALKVVFNGELDLLAVNAKIASCVMRHDYVNPSSDRIEIPLREESDDEPSITLTMTRTNYGTWYVEVIIDGIIGTLSELAPTSRFALSADEVLKERSDLERRFRALPYLDNIIDYETIFDPKHIARFPDEIQTWLYSDPDAAIKYIVGEFNASLARFKLDPRSWMTIPFSKGRERLLKHAGDSTTTHIQLCAPLCLTASERNNQQASVYAVCEYARDPENGMFRCWIPSVLDATTAMSDANNLRRALKCDYASAA